MSATRNPRGFLDARAWLRGLIKAVIRPRPRTRLWKWIDQHVKIPESSGGPNPGRMRTGRFPIFRGLYDLAQQRQVHFLTLCSSARAGKTLFSICLVLYWIAERFGQVVWLDPTRNSARKLVRDEIEDFLLECTPVRSLAVITKKAWTTLEKAFRGKRFRLVGSGAEADLHGFNAELAIENELDRCRASTSDDAASSDKIEARTALFASSRLIVRNSTPGEKGEFGPIWVHFQAGSQHYCYLPCPHCSAEREKEMGVGPQWKPLLPTEEETEPGRSPLSYDPRLAGWQRLTFFVEKAIVPFDIDLNPLKDANANVAPRTEWREEVTGKALFEKFAIMEDRPADADPTRLEKKRVGWRIDGVRKGTTFECAHCKKEIEQVDQKWMLDRYRWVAHNPYADEEHVSAHTWAFYSPFQAWGVLAVEFLQAKGNLGLLIKFWNLVLGKPFIRSGTAIKEDDLDRVIGRCPVPYLQGQIPLEAEYLTITVDRQGTSRWYTIRAWGILWDHPELQSWSALIDWGEIGGDKQIPEKAGHVPDANGNLRRFKYTSKDGQTAREYAVLSGLFDAGYEKDQVWEFCRTQSTWLSPSRGMKDTNMGGSLIRVEPVMDGEIDEVRYWSNYFAADLYYSCILDGKNSAGVINWWLPTNIDADYRKQLTDEYQGEDRGKRVWMTRTKTNHLGDCEKLQRVLSGKIEEALDELRDARAAAEAKKSEPPPV